ncbi:MAG TPA: DUF2834 domain-containing protein [Xenococcaceae cyanobacterium]
MKKKLIFGLIWLGFVSYAFLFAPPDAPDTFDLIINLASGKLQGINPLIIALFNLMGVLPLIYTCFLLFDGRSQKLPAWLFALVSFGVGAFAILPYLALRQPSTVWQGEKNLLLKILESSVTGIIVTIATIVLLWWGISKGDWSDFIQQWHSSRFIHVMSLDFCLLCLLLPVVVKDDLARRNIKNPGIFWAIVLIPLLGTLVYLCLRSFLESNFTEQQLKISN